MKINMSVWITENLNILSYDDVVAFVKLPDAVGRVAAVMVWD